MSDFDLAIVGGGINGVGIARDAAGRGLRVLLVEQNDLASGTSSASTKMIHGGLRYLEHGWFRLVREALSEREVMLRMTPHLVSPMRFVLPLEPGRRPAWQLRLGLLVYDYLGGRRILPPSRSIDLSADPHVGTLKGRYRRGFEYSDCVTDDARLVVLNAVDAAARGALIRTRTRCLSAERGSAWKIVLEARGRRDVATARVLVNATGPWLGQFVQGVLRMRPPSDLRLDKGSHIVVRRLFGHDRGYIFQTADGRVVFVLPYERNFTLVGTTDSSFSGDPALAKPTAEEISYLCAVVNDHLRAVISPADVVWAFAGVRSLYDDGASRPQDAMRDYVLRLDEDGGKAPLLSIYGGKITTYRRLAEAALDRLAHVLGARPAWTRKSRLPGGDFELDGVPRLIAQARRTWPFLSEAHARRLVHAYGTRISRILGPAKRATDLGPSFGADLTGAEVRYLMEHEWARTADDVLWRRSKLGLRMSRAECERLARFMTDAIGSGAQ
ncbi:MAG TPA: glycerol-3-phosphate dehydrogenase [Xanthobacteraceae bacterium]|nr:glycerol-3-phosphate dehydrogenase [Xanthobacteraceae bacterium]